MRFTLEPPTTKPEEAPVALRLRIHDKEDVWLEARTGGRWSGLLWLALDGKVYRHFLSPEDIPLGFKSSKDGRIAIGNPDKNGER